MHSDTWLKGFKTQAMGFKLWDYVQELEDLIKMPEKPVISSVLLRELRATRSAIATATAEVDTQLTEVIQTTRIPFIADLLNKD